MILKNICKGTFFFGFRHELHEFARNNSIGKFL